MNARVLAVMAMAVIAASAAYADIVTFENGDQVEGYAHTNETTLRLYDRTKVNLTECPVAMVANIKYGEWLNKKDTNVVFAAKVSTNVVSRSLGPKEAPWALIVKNLFSGSGTSTNAAGAKAAKKDIGKQIQGIAIIVGAVVLDIIAIVVWFVVVIDAFKNSVMWGLLCLFTCGIGWLIYVFTKYEGSKMKVLMWTIIMPIIWGAIGGFLLQSMAK